MLPCIDPFSLSLSPGTRNDACVMARIACLQMEAQEKTEASKVELERRIAVCKMGRMVEW